VKVKTSVNIIPRKKERISPFYFFDDIQSRIPFFSIHKTKFSNLMHPPGIEPGSKPRFRAVAFSFLRGNLPLSFLAKRKERGGGKALSYR
jgi:hypothetical protein